MNFKICQSNIPGSMLNIAYSEKLQKWCDSQCHVPEKKTGWGYKNNGNRTKNRALIKSYSLQKCIQTNVQ